MTNRQIDNPQGEHTVHGQDSDLKLSDIELIMDTDAKNKPLVLS